MFDQSHGLRFDIYERIHLPAELPGIAELEEVELLPEIQVIQREDRAELYGQLLLTGLYRSEDDRTQRLEHAIPVEITVPLTRVSSLKDIGVEIENFDIDLLTMRTVNITGVLSLRGIGGAEAVPAWQQEEYTVAYTPAEEGRTSQLFTEDKEREGDSLYENSVWTFGEGAAEATVEEREEDEASADAVEQSVFLDPPDSPSAEDKDKEQTIRTHSLDTQSADLKFEGANNWNNSEVWNQNTAEEPADTPRESEDTAVLNQNEEKVVLSEEETHKELYAQEAAVPDPEADQAGEVFVSQETTALSPPEEKPDLKVALGSKKDDAVKEKEHLTFSSLLSTSRTRKEQEELLAEETASVAAGAIPEAGNHTEWKNRFIGGAGGSNLFRKVRLCIVQREETLDTIAEKYQLSARELVMYNRLSGQSVEEGQVLYIP